MAGAATMAGAAAFAGAGVQVWMGNIPAFFTERQCVSALAAHGLCPSKVVLRGRGPDKEIHCRITSS